MNWMVTVVRRVALDRLLARRTVPVSLTDESVAVWSRRCHIRRRAIPPGAGPAKVPRPSGNKITGNPCPFGILLRPEATRNWPSIFPFRLERSRPGFTVLLRSCSYV